MSQGGTTPRTDLGIAVGIVTLVLVGEVGHHSPPFVVDVICLVIALGIAPMLDATSVLAMDIQLGIVTRKRSSLND